MNPIVNIAGYHFVPLTDLSELRTEMMNKCNDLGLKGTILLSLEGINLSLAGSAAAIAQFQSYLKQDARWAEMSFRESLSADVPFRFMRVKLKKEIITMKRPEVRPELGRAPSLSPQEFKQWLDENRDITVLDTRNDYEVKFGTFDKAIHFQIEDFSEFPEAAANLSKAKPIVMFCTGGVRCEKAGLHLLNQGYSDVYQLDGGILNYFKEVGGAHYHGDCFVFDQRVALDAQCKVSGTLQCHVCQGPIPAAQFAEGQSVAKVSCAVCVN